MFLYKDERFGCFPKACAVVLFSKDSLKAFLGKNTDIDNRLACIVRDILKQEYLPLVLAVIAAFGIQLIEPFHAVTISKKTNHINLNIYLHALYQKMSERHLHQVLPSGQSLESQNIR